MVAIFFVHLKAANKEGIMFLINNRQKRSEQ